MADVNAWSIIVPGVVTPCVVAGFAWWHQHVARQAEERREVRDVLDLATDALLAAVRTLDALMNSWATEGRYGHGDLDEAMEKMYGLTLARGRLELRVGEKSPVAKAYRVAFQRCTNYQKLVGGGHLAGERFDAGVVREARTAAGAAAGAFIREATLLVGLAAGHSSSPLWRTLALSRDRES